MKKFNIEVSEDAHTELLKIQMQRRIEKHPRTTLKDVASDFLEEKLMERKEKENPSK